MSSAPHTAPVGQISFDELGVPLREVTFVVVDLETTGGSPTGAAITEVGAVKVRGGEALGEFATLVDPGGPIPPFITVLTGITDAMVRGAPRIEAVLPAFLEFARGSVLVAHNAPFDVGFLRAACERTGRDWPGFDVVDTARLARQLLSRDEAVNCKLATLARLFPASTVPSHRALDDARATVAVLHGLFERLGPLGVESLDELRTLTARVSPAQRRKRHLADGLPTGPGVYIFRDARGVPLYIGTSRDVRGRVRRYFVASEPRTRMAEMVALADRVDVIECAHPLEASVRELRLIADHVPRYNRRSRHPERSVYLKLTVEPFPRLSIVRGVRDDGATYLGPFGSLRAAEDATAAVHEAVPLRQCRDRLGPRRRRAPCALAGMGRCPAPCDGRIATDGYAEVVAAAVSAIRDDPQPVVDTVLERINRLATAERFEEAARFRDRLTAFLGAVGRQQRLVAVTGCPLLVAGRTAADGGVELAVVRHGRLVAAGVAPPGAGLGPYVDALVATAESVRPGPGPAPCASVEETECVLRWLVGPTTRLLELEGTWCSPIRAAAGVLIAAGLGSSPDRGGGGGHALTAALAAVTDTRALRPVHHPPGLLTG